MLNYSTRNEVIPVGEDGLGVDLKYCEINDCILRLIKVFPGSPCEEAGILVNEYIVGIKEGEYKCLQTFADALRKCIKQDCQFITLGICNGSGCTRLVTISAVAIDKWKTAKKGILGCELAEGWLHKFHPVLK